MKTLFLFDIDGTLVNVNDLHAAAYQAAYQAVVGMQMPLEAIEGKFGKPEKQIHAELFREYGIRNGGKEEDVSKKYRETFLALLASTPPTPLPGVVEFLTTLKSNAEYLGIISGNPPSSGRRILDSAGLTRFFSVFSFDTGVSSREEIVRNAIKQASREGYRYGRVVVIGDTPHDVRAGQAAGAFMVAIAKKGGDEEGLAEADLIVRGLAEYKKILEALM